MQCSERRYDDVAIVVPMYNESAAVGAVIGDLHEHFSTVICVDDGSRDASATIAREAGAEVLRHPVNLGQGAALQTGFDHALRDPRVRFVVTFDADGQYQACDAAAMVDLARAEGVDIVLGSRNLGAAPGQPLARRLLMAAALRFSNATTGVRLTDTHNGLRVLNRHATAAMRLRHRGMAHASEIESRIASQGLSWREHPITMRYSAYSRGKGQSNLNAFNILFDLATARFGSAA